MAYSHCTGLGPGAVQGTGLVHEETMGPDPCPCPCPETMFCINLQLNCGSGKIRNHAFQLSGSH